MFNRKKIKNLNVRLDLLYNDFLDLQRLNYEKISSENIVQCDGCGCLLLKSSKFKQPSTVEVKEIVSISPGNQGISGHSGISNYGSSGTLAPYHQTYTQKKEAIVEHYKCLKCAPPDVQLNKLVV